MNNYYTIIISEPPPEKTKIILARKLASTPEISLEDAVSFLDSVPFTYLKSIPEQKMKREVLWLKNMNIKFRVSIDKKPREINKQSSSFSFPKKTVRHPQKTDTKRSAVNLHKTTEKKEPLILNPEKPDKKNSSGYFKVILVFLVLSVVFLLLYRWQKTAQPPELPAGGSFSPASEKRNPVKPGPDKSHTSSSKAKQRRTADKNDRRISESYADSAKKFAPTPDQAIKFYKMAISFNRNNLNAWIGLVNAYNEAEMSLEAIQTKKEMEKIFGPEAISLKEFVKQYGTLMNYGKDREGVCRIRYESSSKDKKDLYRETYSILKFIKSRTGFSSANVFSETGRGTGMLINIKGEPFPSTLSEYKKTASIDIID